MPQNYTIAARHKLCMLFLYIRSPILGSIRRQVRKRARDIGCELSRCKQGIPDPRAANGARQVSGETQLFGRFCCLFDNSGYGGAAELPQVACVFSFPHLGAQALQALLAQLRN